MSQRTPPGKTNKNIALLKKKKKVALLVEAGDKKCGIPPDLASLAPALWDPDHAQGPTELYISAFENKHSDTANQGRK